jgi:hypothetical protein
VEEGNRVKGLHTPSIFLYQVLQTVLLQSHVLKGKKKTTKHILKLPQISGVYVHNLISNLEKILQEKNK